MGESSKTSNHKQRQRFSFRRGFFVFSFFLALFYASPMYKSVKTDCDLPICLPIRHILSEIPGYLVYTPTCKIPEIDPFHRSVKPYLSNGKLMIKCPKLLVRADGDILRYVEPLEQYKNSTCCVQNIRRKQQDPNNYDENADWLLSTSKNCTEIPKADGLKFPSEFVQVNCKYLHEGKEASSKDFYGVPFSPKLHSSKTAAKADYWTEKNSSKSSFIPPSVLIVGIDSISRMHFLRSMPQTKEFLHSNDFIEMKGYTKIGENTFPNFMGFLGGMELHNYPCWNRTKKEKFDNCPLIWKNFSREGYVTAFLEDTPGLASFNYKRTGFVKQPTDYYMRTLGVAFHGNLGHSKAYKGCVGGLSQTQMMLRYMRQFIKAMGPVPYFLLSWYTSAAHDDFNGLKPLDGKFKDFLHDAVHNSQANGDNTLILFISDHGYRFGKFRETILGYYEESLPFFFIRLPSSLKAIRPHWYENLRVNGQRLTSPLDLHATFEDILSLSANQTDREHSSYTHSNWDSSVNRSVYSFFEETPITRTCESAKIPQQYCRCGVSASMESKPKPSLKFGHAVVKAVNDMMANEIQTNKCVSLSFKKFLYVREIGEGDLWNHFGKLIPYRDHLVALEASPSGAHFEAKVRLFPTNNTLTTVGDISRINSYDGENECLKDYSLQKNYCMCKDFYEKVQLTKKADEAKNKQAMKFRRRKNVFG